MKIGEFAKRGNISIKALRLYHDMHLVEPAIVDESGHRFYTEQNLKKLRKVQSLKKLGFSLLEIRNLIDDKLPTINESLQFQKEKIKNEIEKRRHELHRIEVAQAIIKESADIDKMTDTVNKLSQAEEYLSVVEIKKIESINRSVATIQELISDKKNWYEGMQDAFTKSIPVDDPQVQEMASKWNLYATYWKEQQPDIARKVKSMNEKKSQDQLGLVATPEFQTYVKKAIEISKNRKKHF